MPTTERSTVRFTVDLPLSMHKALTNLAKQQGVRKAALVRIAISGLSLKDEVQRETFLQEETVRLTIDMELGAHEEFSILAIRKRRSKAELVRWAIDRLLQDVKSNSVGQ